MQKKDRNRGERSLNMFRSTLLLLCALFSLSAVSSAQEMEVTGTVVDEAGEAVIGATILEEGTMNGTVTDLDGTFRITVQQGSHLIVRSVGFASQRVEVTGGRVTVMMQTDYLKLDEVQVVAYGTKTRREISGAIANIDQEVVKSNVNTSVISGLTGRSAGLDIGNSPDGRNASIRIRGVTSLRSGSAPLVVVDGMPTSLGLNDINQEDIESISVLKDAAASVLYGSRASNGVILITTRQGQAGRTQVNVNYQHGFLMPSTTDIPLMNADQWREAYTTAATNRYGDAAPFSNPSDGRDGFYSFDRRDPVSGDLLYEATYYETDWLGMVLDDHGAFDRLSINASGGSESTTFYTSVLYRNDNGYLGSGDEQRINARLNVRHEFNEMLRAGINVSGNIRLPDPQNIMVGYSTAQQGALPIYPVYSPTNPDRFWFKYEEIPNPLAEATYSADFSEQLNFLNSVYLEFEPLERLVFRTEWQSDYRVSGSEGWKHPYINPFGTGSGGGDGMTTVRKGESHTWNSNNTVTYSISLGEHRISALGGFNFLSGYGGSGTTFQEQVANTSFQHSNGFYDRIERVASGWGSRRFASGLGRLNYSYADKYFLEASYRVDGSSRFGPDRRWGDFPGVSASWIFTEEDFLKELLPFLYLGRLRASWGEVGNAETGGDFQYLGTSLTWFNYGGYRGESYNNIGNSTLQWETTKQTDIGLDLAMFRGRINLTVDYFDKLSEDLLLTYRIGQFHGYWNSSITQNVGSLKFRGWEFTLNSVNVEGLGGGFKWATDFNISFQRSEVLKLSNNAHNIVDDTNIAVEGQPLGAYYLVQWAGVDPVLGHELIYEVDPVDYLTNPAAAYIDHLSGNLIDASTMLDGAYAPHKVIDPDKSPYPDFYGGLTNTFSYRGVEFSFLFVYQFGNWFYDSMEKTQSYISSTKNASPVLLNGWTAENPTDIPLMLDSPMAGRDHSRYLHNASYIRLRDITLAYDLPAEWVAPARLDRLRIFAKAQNTWIWTKWPGIEPEATWGATDNISPGVRGFVKPMALTFVLGADIGF